MPDSSAPSLAFLVFRLKNIIDSPNAQPPLIPIKAIPIIIVLFIKSPLIHKHIRIDVFMAILLCLLTLPAIIGIINVNGNKNNCIIDNK